MADAEDEGEGETIAATSSEEDDEGASEDGQATDECGYNSQVAGTFSKTLSYWEHKPCYGAQAVEAADAHLVEELAEKKKARRANIHVSKTLKKATPKINSGRLDGTGQRTTISVATTKRATQGVAKANGRAPVPAVKKIPAAAARLDAAAAKKNVSTARKIGGTAKTDKKSTTSARADSSKLTGIRKKCRAPAPNATWSFPRAMAGKKLDPKAAKLAAAVE